MESNLNSTCNTTFLSQNSTNCSFSNETSASTVNPLFTEWTNPVLGTIYVLQGIIYLIPYAPCAIVLWRPPLIENPAYKIMAAMAIADCTNLLVGSIWGGFSSLLGLSFIEWRITQRFFGAVANAMWYTYCALNYILAANRIAEMASPDGIATLLFRGYRSYIWVVSSFGYGFLGFIAAYFFGELLYHGKYGILFFDPLTEPGGLRICLLANQFNNYLVSTLLPLEYVVVYWLFHKKLKVADTSSSDTNKKEKLFLIQAFMISALTSLTGVGYVLVPVMVTDVRYYFIMTIVWQAMQGMNAFIYLIFNRSVRNEVKKLLGMEQSTSLVTAVHFTGAVSNTMVGPRENGASKHY